MNTLPDRHPKLDRDLGTPQVFGQKYIYENGHEYAVYDCDGVWLASFTTREEAEEWKERKFK